MFIVIDPIGLVPLYIGLTSNIQPALKKGIINKAVIIAFLVLLGFVLLGRYILALLHIEPGSFFIAGGIMLFIVSLEMLFGRTSQSKTSEKENPASVDNDGHSVAIFPLAIPMLAGPGALTTIILYTGGYSSGGRDFSLPEVAIMLIISIVLILAITVVAFRSAGLIIRVLGKTGVSVLERIMGLILAGLSVQFFYDGVISLGFLK